MGVLLLKQANRVLSTYAADVSGVCSALYELGGMTVMHDASGCNSTYSTHDEPRWYDTDSLVFLSALTEVNAVMGADDKLIADVTETALSLRPKFIALAGSPIPMITGVDLPGVARVIEEKTGIPAFGFNTNGMHSYLPGVSRALAAVAERFCGPCERDAAPSVNILGATPLDLSVTGTAEALRGAFEARGIRVNSCWAMGSSLDELAGAARARVNAVVSSSGLAAAGVLRRRFGTPYVVGLPFGAAFSDAYFGALREAAASGENRSPARTDAGEGGAPIFLIGEAVYMTSLRAALRAMGRKNVRVLCPLECSDGLLSPDDLAVSAEEDIREALRDARLVIADPMYAPVLPGAAELIALPHEAYSGRIYRRQIPVLVGSALDEWIEEKRK